MESTEKECVKILTDLLFAKMIQHVVLSPGSRNAPLLVAFAREPWMQHFVVLDERSAAFFALGMAQQVGGPVALVCTSGSALLNYAPAIAEAWYQRIPLIVISADRPAAWIDQDDSQTIRQNGVLSNLVKASRQLPVEIRDEEDRWYANRIVNEVVNCAMKGRKGPVHLNVPIGEPLYGVRDYPSEYPRYFTFIDTVHKLDNEVMQRLAKEFRQSPRVMILAGFGAPEDTLQEALQQLAGYNNVIVLSENISNLDDLQYITTIDRVLSSIPEAEKSDFAPDVLISFGGALVSRQVKTFLRNHPPRKHWSIDNSEFPADTFKCLTTQINLEANDFFGQLSKQMNEEGELDHITGCGLSSSNRGDAQASTYAARWSTQEKRATAHHEQFVAKAPWSDLKAFAILMPMLPEESHLQVSNGTPVRYAQLFKHPQVSRRDSNRGTSGIEGATSVAVGASLVYDGLTILITGDMSFLYDSNALWNRYITPRLKIVVMKNGGGGIFRFIPGPSELEELEECFETAQDVNVRGFAMTHHFQYYKATNETELKNILPIFFTIGANATILEIETPRLENDRILKDYFKQLNK